MSPDLPPVDETCTPNEGPGPSLVVFDFDGTLAEQRGGWGLLYRLFGVESAGESRTTAYWDGDITFGEWCDGNLADWRARDVRREHLSRAADAVKLTAGAPALLDALGEYGVPFGVVSGGVRDLLEPVAPYDPAFLLSNEVVYDADGVPVDAVPRVPPDGKGEILASICENAGIDAADVVYVGDSHTDEEALAVAGTAVLFDPDDRIDESAYETADILVEERDLALLREPILRDAL